MSSTQKSLSYPEPFVVEARTTHKRSLILLHGRGSSGRKFGSDFVQSATSSPVEQTVGSVLADTKFVFPTARKRRAKWYNRATINQWFDSVPIDEQDAGMTQEQQEWQLEGLRQSRCFLKSIFDKEIELVGVSNVFIGGLSQGCAMALHLLLSLENTPTEERNTIEPVPLAGFIGMSGWLPFINDIEELVHPVSKQRQSNDDSEDDPFGPATDDSNDDEDGSVLTTDNDASSTHILARVCNLVRGNMDLPPIASSQPFWLKTPILLGHGKHDEKVLPWKGRQAASLLKDAGMEVTWREYDEGHWYKVPDQMDDIVAFLQANSSPEAAAT